MNYSNDMLCRIEELAAALTSIADIAIILDIDADDLRRDIRDKRSEVYTVYHRAKAQIKLKLRQQELELAKIGSPLAVQMSREYLYEMDQDEDL